MTADARGFPAFAPARRVVGSRHFAQSWWGRAWIRALEETALDRDALRDGRRYAKSGRVGAITVSPGRIAGPVYDEEQYRAEVAVPRLSDGDWNRLLTAVAGQAGHLAALLDGELPPELVQTAADAGVRLLPAPVDLEPDCDCPDWGHPCRHAAALCYQFSWLLDDDPLLLLLVRGRGQEALLSQLQARGEDSGVDLAALRWLVAAAAVRARELLDGLEPCP